MPTGGEPNWVTARWLAELTDALMEAQRLAWHLAMERGRPAAFAIYEEIEAALAEAHALRLSRRSGAAAEYPEWTHVLPWRMQEEESGA